MNATRRRLHGFAMMSVFAGILLFASSCLDDDNQNIEPIKTAYVSLYNASPDAPDLDIIVDQRRINNNPFDYGEYTGYLPFYTGQRNLRFGPYGANNVVVDTTLDLKVDQAYSIFVVDNYEHADVLVTEDSGNPGEGQAMVRFLNLSPDAPAVRLDSAASGTPLFDDQTFKETSAFTPIDAGTYDFTVRAGGQSLLEMPATQVYAGRYYTIIVRGYQTPPAGNNHVLSSEVIIE
jgi:hypothetical protein